MIAILYGSTMDLIRHLYDRTQASPTNHQEADMNEQHSANEVVPTAVSPTSLIHLDGMELFVQPCEHLWERLTDLSFVVRCMPDLDKVVLTEPNRIVFRVKPGFSFIRGTLEITLALIDARRPDRARMRIGSKGVGSGVKMEASFLLADAETSATGQTCLAWSAEVLELQGLLKPVGKSLIAAAARQVIAAAFARLRTELTGE
jgi:carbon monoxide dehydrogenase subunit G